MDANPQSINSTEDIKLILSSFYNKISKYFFYESNHN